MMRCTGLDPTDPRFAELELAADRFRTRNDAVSCVLERARCLFGGLPLVVLHRVADLLDLPRSDIYQAAAVDDLFASRPEGAHTIAVCLGSHCYAAGADKLFDRLQAELAIGPGETTPDGRFTLQVCYGGEACGDEPGIAIDGERIVITPDAIPELLRSYREEAILIHA